jgi:hypothetical protein
MVASKGPMENTATPSGSGATVRETSAEDWIPLAGALDLVMAQLSVSLERAKRLIQFEIRPARWRERVAPSIAHMDLSSVPEWHIEPIDSARLTHAGIDWTEGSMFSAKDDSSFSGIEVESYHLRASLKSLATKQAANKRDFENRAWPVGRVLAWIAYRDPEHLDRPWWRAKVYDHPSSPKGPPLKNDRPPDSLLKELQEGCIRAYKNGSALAPEVWLDYKASQWRQWPDVQVKREKVLVIWPDGTSAPEGAISAVSASTAADAPLTDKDGVERRPPVGTTSDKSSGPKKEKRARASQADIQTVVTTYVGKVEFAREAPTQSGLLKFADEVLPAATRTQLFDQLAKVVLPRRGRPKSLKQS